MNILTNLDFNKNQLLNGSLQNLAVAPSSPVKGQFYFNTASNSFQVYDGSKWLTGGVADLPDMIIGDITGLQSALDGKVNNSRVMTDVPLGAKFTDTVVDISGKADKTYVDLELDKKETLVGAQTKATKALTDAKTYVDGKVKTDVPVGAIFTDTKYTATSLGLGNVNNTTDLAKPISTATKTALDGKVDNARVLTDVPLGAKFTDTTYTKSSLGLGNVDNTSDLAKPISTATQTALNAKESIANVSTKVAGAENNAKSYTDTKISDLIGNSPEALDTLKELADALGNDPNFATTMTNMLSLKTNKYKANVGDGTKTTYVITHSLNSKDIVVQLRQSGSPFEVVYTDIEMTTVNTITIRFAKAPTLNEYVITVIG